MAGVSPLPLLPLPAGPAVLECLPTLRRALTGEHPLVPHAAGERAPTLAPFSAQAPLQPGAAIVVATSGSTGPSKLAVLSAQALAHSAAATETALRGPGTWLLALPPHHIAGLQVLLRSVHANTVPTVMELQNGFTATAFTAAVADMPASLLPRYTSLVPTQLSRVLADPAATAALRTFQAVLVGGAATAPSLAARARRAGIALRLTYGMSETCGGCVYDGTALNGISIRIDDGGRIALGGPVVAHGYLGHPPDAPDSPFEVTPDGTRWFRTDDLGHLQDGRLVVSGRADDVIITGGVKVHPGVVEAAIVKHAHGVDEALVVGVPDPEWGQVVAVGLRMLDPTTRLTAADLREALRGIVPDAALPRRALTLTSIPLRGPGKPDREALREAFGDRP